MSQGDRLVGAGGGSRTHTRRKPLGILSPARLPVSPLRHSERNDSIPRPRASPKPFSQNRPFPTLHRQPRLTTFDAERGSQNPTNGSGRRESPKDLRAAEPRLNLSLSRYTPTRSGRLERPGGFGCAVSESECKAKILELWPVLLRFLVPSCILIASRDSSPPDEILPRMGDT